LELRQLKYLIGIVEAGSVSRASQALHIAQPALSQQIGRLEDELGVKLLTRSVRGVLPTEAGLAVLQQAKAILKQVEATRSIAAQAEGGLTGKVAIGLPWTITMLLGLSLLRTVREQLPAVQLELVEGPSPMLGGLLAQGKLDVAVLFESATSGGLAMEPVLIEPLLFIGASGTLSDRSEMSLPAAAAFPLVLLSRPNGIREAVERRWAEAGVKPHVLAEINAPALLVQAVRDGLGFSVLPSCGIDVAVQAGELDAVPLTDATMTRHIHIATSRLYPPPPAAASVIEMLRRLMFAAVDEGRWFAQRAL
jgi:DNA-binding transcriptional LysR family regulator